MSAAFTVTGDNFLDIDKLEELRLAFSERSAFVGYDPHRKYEVNGSTYAWVEGDGTSSDTMASNEPTSGFNAQALAFFLTPQFDVENYLIYSYCQPNSTYYDLDNDIYVDEGTSGYVDISYGTFMALCEECGGSMYTSDSDYGWRKVTELDPNGDPIFTRGQIEEGDYLGGWLAEDLVLVYKTLKTAVLYPNSSPNGYAALLFYDEVEGTDIIIYDGTPYGADGDSLIVNGSEYVDYSTTGQAAREKTVVEIASHDDPTNDWITVTRESGRVTIEQGGETSWTNPIVKADQVIYELYITVTKPIIACDTSGTITSTGISVSLRYSTVWTPIDGEEGEQTWYDEEYKTATLSSQPSATNAGFACGLKSYEDTDDTTPIDDEVMFDASASDEGYYPHCDIYDSGTSARPRRCCESVFTGSDIGTLSDLTFDKGEFFTYFARYSGTEEPDSFSSTILSAVITDGTGYARDILDEETECSQGFPTRDIASGPLSVYRDYTYTLIPDFTNA